MGVFAFSLPLTTSLASNVMQFVRKGLKWWTGVFKRKKKEKKGQFMLTCEGQRAFCVYGETSDKRQTSLTFRETRFDPVLKKRILVQFTGQRTRLASRCYETNVTWSVFNVVRFLSPCGFIVCCGRLEVPGWTNEAGERAGMPLRHDGVKHCSAAIFIPQNNVFSFALLILSDVIHHPTCEQKRKKAEKRQLEASRLIYVNRTQTKMRLKTGCSDAPLCAISI